MHVRDRKDALATDVVEQFVFYKSPTNQTIDTVFLIPGATPSVTANDTNYAGWTLSNSDPTGSTGGDVATLTTKTGGAGGSGNFDSPNEIAFTLTGFFAEMATGDILSLAVTKAAAGVALPPWMVRITFVPT